MNIQARLALIFGGLLLSTLAIGGAAYVSTLDLTSRVATADQAELINQQIQTMEYDLQHYRETASLELFLSVEHQVDQIHDEIDQLLTRPTLRDTLTAEARPVAEAMLATFDQYGPLLAEIRNVTEQKVAATAAMQSELDRLSRDANLLNRLQKERFDLLVEITERHEKAQTSIFSATEKIGDLVLALGRVRHSTQEYLSSFVVLLDRPRAVEDLLPGAVQRGRFYRRRSEAEFDNIDEALESLGDEFGSAAERNKIDWLRTVASTYRDSFHAVSDLVDRMIAAKQSSNAASTDTSDIVTDPPSRTEVSDGFKLLRAAAIPLQTEADVLLKEMRRRHRQLEQQADEARHQLALVIEALALSNQLISIKEAGIREIAQYRADRNVSEATVILHIQAIGGTSNQILDLEPRIDPRHQSNEVDKLVTAITAAADNFRDEFRRFARIGRTQENAVRTLVGIDRDVHRHIRTIVEAQTESARESGQRMMTTVGGSIVLALLLGGVGAVTVRQRVGRPIAAITETMQAMAAGELERPVPFLGNHDELGAMANALSVFREEALEARRLGDERADYLERSLAKERELNGLQRQFVSLVSHELRTPLAVIDGIAQRLIRRGDKLDRERRDAELAKIRLSVTRLIELMTSVLSSARLDAGKIEFSPKSCNLQEIVAEAASSQQSVCENHRIRIDVDQLPEDFRADPILLHQVITNLLSNAVKYSPHQRLVDVIGRSASDEVTIAVRDYGLGIPENELAKLFSQYFRASTSTGIAGTGIGLYLVQALVDMHGGRVEVESAMGEGSTFRIHLPIRLAETEDRTKQNLSSEIPEILASGPQDQAMAPAAPG